MTAKKQAAASGNIASNHPAETTGVAGGGITGLLAGLGLPHWIVVVVGIVSAVAPFIVTAWRQIHGLSGIRDFLLHG